MLVSTRMASRPSWRKNSRMEDRPRRAVAALSISLKFLLTRGFGVHTKSENDHIDTNNNRLAIVLLTHWPQEGKRVLVRNTDIVGLKN